MDRDDSGLEEGDSYEINAILDYRKYKNDYKYLIRWTGYGREEAEWRTAWQLRHAQDLIDEY